MNDFPPLKDRLSMYKIYKKKYKGNDHLQTYLNNINLFFEITLESYIFGDLTRPEKFGGGFWDSRDHSLQFWAEKCSLSPRHLTLYFKSVDDFAHYS